MPVLFFLFAEARVVVVPGPDLFLARDLEAPAPRAEEAPLAREDAPVPRVAAEEEARPLAGQAFAQWPGWSQWKHFWPDVLGPPTPPVGLPVPLAGHAFAQWPGWSQWKHFCPAPLGPELVPPPEEAPFLLGQEVDRWPCWLHEKQV